MGTHSRLSPSAAKRWLVCSGSLLFKEDGRSSPYAEDGTFRHAVLEMILQGGNPLVGDKLEGRAIETLHIEQALEVKAFIQTLRDCHPVAALETETKIECGAVFGLKPGICMGTADGVVYSSNELTVLDAKFGFVRVEPENNPQLNIYALGLLTELALPIEHIVVIIAQPDYAGDMEFREHRMTRNELLQWAFDNQDAVARAAAEDPTLTPTVEACRYCPGALTCSARMQSMEVFAQETWRETYTLEELVPHVEQLEQICKDIKREALARLLEGGKLEGYKLVAARSTRKWTSDEDLVAEMKKLGLDPELAFEKKVRSPAKLEKILDKGTVKKLPVFNPAGKPKLVPNSNPQPALEMDSKFTPEEIKALMETNE